MYQVFSSLQGHLQFFVHFFFTFMEHFFIDHPIFYKKICNKTVIMSMSAGRTGGQNGGQNGQKWFQCDGQTI